MKMQNGRVKDLLYANDMLKNTDKERHNPEKIYKLNRELKLKKKSNIHDEYNEKRMNIERMDPNCKTTLK